MVSGGIKVHCLARNKTTIYYALVDQKTEITDDDGNKTGQYRITYKTPVKWLANVRWDSGAVELDGFGLNANGTRRIVTSDLNCPISIDTVLWVGIEPDTNGFAGTVKPNYVVSGVIEKSLNHLAFNIKEVNLS